MSTSSTDEEDAAMSPATLTPRASLLDLPDELLTRIFDLLAEVVTVTPGDRDDYRRNMLAFGEITLNSRIYRLCRRRLVRRLRLCAYPDIAEVALPELLLRRDVTTNAEALDMHLENVQTRLANIALVHFPNLTYLSLHYDIHTPHLLQALSSLQCLHTLVIHPILRRNNSRPDTLDLRRCASSIRHLVVHYPTLPDVAALASIVTNLDGLEHLELRGDAHTVCLDESIPWSSLRSFTVRAFQTRIVGAGGFMEGLKKACEHAASANRRLPMRRLVVDYREGLLTPRTTRLSPTRILDMLALLSQHANVKELELPHSTLSQARFARTELPTVYSLKLHGWPADGTSSYDMQDYFGPLLKFLSLFPNLRRLDIGHAEEASFWPQDVMSRAECAVRCPAFFALIFLLDKTAITKIGVEWVRDLWKVQWTREAGSADWRGERYLNYGFSTYRSAGDAQ